MSSYSNIIRPGRLQEKLDLGKGTIANLRDPKSPQFDPTFPLAISLGARAIGWIEAEIDEWLASRPRVNPKQHEKPHMAPLNVESDACTQSRSNLSRKCQDEAQMGGQS